MSYLVLGFAACLALGLILRAAQDDEAEVVRRLEDQQDP